MQARARTRNRALSVLAASAASAAAGLGLLLRDGGCAHALLGLQRGAPALPMSGMAGMEMATLPALGSMCPILAAVVLALAVGAIAALIALAAPAVAHCIAAAVRTLAPAALAPPIAAVPALVPAGRGVLLARRRPSRAPPSPI